MVFEHFKGSERQPHWLSWTVFLHEFQPEAGDNSKIKIARTYKVLINSKRFLQFPRCKVGKRQWKIILLQEKSKVLCSRRALERKKLRNSETHSFARFAWCEKNGGLRCLEEPTHLTSTWTLTFSNRGLCNHELDGRTFAELLFFCSLLEEQSSICVRLFLNTKDMDF